MTRLVAWGDVQPGSVVWDASPTAGGEGYASVAVRWPACDGAQHDGAWIAVWGHPSCSASGKWSGLMWTGPAGPTVPDFAWNAHTFELTREGVEVLATGLTAEECAALGAKNPSEVKAWCAARGEGHDDVISTRSEAGQATYDARVLAVLTVEPQAASVLIEIVGGSAAQARASLARLIERGQARVIGNGRGTKYALDTSLQNG